MDSPHTQLFPTPLQPQPVATIFLVENSRTMSSFWPDLRDQYLLKIVDSLAVANPSAPLTVSVLESCPFQDLGSNSSLPRQYSGHDPGLTNIRFNFAADNKITVSAISHCIDFLNSGKFDGRLPALHLVVVAATTPSEGGHASYPLNSPYSPWILLAQKMVKHNVQCHLALIPQGDMSPFTVLFEETLRLQGNIEAGAPFLLDKQLLFRFSTTPTFNGDSASAERSNPLQSTTHRRNSYPLDNFGSLDQATTHCSQPSNPEHGPTLVTQLQQVHGLTKKKVYGAKPVRQPFFREERVRDKYQGPAPPAPLTMPMHPPESIPSPTSGGRVISQAKSDRMNRLSQASPSDMHARRPFGRSVPRGGSRLSTPEGEVASSGTLILPLDISPGSPYVSSDYPSPITPVSPDKEVYGFPPVSRSPTIHSAPAFHTGGISDSSWSPHNQYPIDYSSQSQSYFPPPSQQGLYTNARSDSRPQQPDVSMTESLETYGLPSTAPTGQSDDANPSKTSMRSSKKAHTGDDEEQFTFGKEYIAATADLFNTEVLPSYPNYPGLTSGLSSGSSQTILANVTPSQTGGLYASRPRARASMDGMSIGYTAYRHSSHPSSSQYYGQPMAGLTHGSYQHTAAYVPPGTSSLTGWAG